MRKQKLFRPNGTDITEDLLQGLIAECGEMIRAQVRPAFDAVAEAHHKSMMVRSAVDLVQTGAKVAEAIARLRGQAEPELRQRITVERIQRLSNNEWGRG